MTRSRYLRVLALAGWIILAAAPEPINGACRPEPDAPRKCDPPVKPPPNDGGMKASPA